MVLTVRFSRHAREVATALLGDAQERHEEFWFGQGLAWATAGEGSTALHFSLVVDVPRIVARTKRRDREDRFAVGYCDSYPYSASGLMALFLARFPLPMSGREPDNVEITLSAYPERPHSEDVARRLFLPAGYSVCADRGQLRLQGQKSPGRVFAELPVLLLALDRRTRLFLDAEELADIGKGRTGWISSHPARQAIEVALAGRPTPLRYLVPAAMRPVAERTEEEIETNLFHGDDPISTGLIASIPLAPSQRDFALKAFSRMNIDRNWLIYLPSAISSLQERTSSNELEHPEAAFKYFRDERIEKVVVEEKHMGSRGIVVLCKSHEAAVNRFGVGGEIPGCAYTRNGRRFFKNEDTEAVFLDRLGGALARANFWNRFSTDWVAFDGEIKPWAVKASESSEESDLVEAGSLVLSQTADALDAGAASALKSYWKSIVERERAALASYDVMFKKYRTEAADLAALRFAPFHLLAVEGKTFFHRSHLWHMQMLSSLARAGNGFLIPTRYEVLNTGEPATWAKTLRWWDELSENSSEGFVVKPLPFVPRGRRGLAQPALKCRTREHLRLVYGPLYDSTAASEALLARESLLHRRNKHRRVLRQFALSMEAVTRFIQRSPLDAIHECVLGVLAQEVPPTMRA